MHAQIWNLLNINYSYIFTVCNFSNIFKILPDVLDPPQTVKKSIRVYEDLENEVQIPKLNLFELVRLKPTNFMSERFTES